MARITENNRRFRTREQIVDDVAFILRAPVSNGTKIVVVENAFWVWTEFDGKYEGCRHWTQSALVQYVQNRRTGAKRHHRLRHEHVVPRDVLLPMLLKDEPPSAAEIRSIFDELLIGVVVELSEDRQLDAYRKIMPPEFSDPSSSGYRDPWLRYKRLGIATLPNLNRQTFRNINQLATIAKKLGETGMSFNQ